MFFPQIWPTPFWLPARLECQSYFRGGRPTRPSCSTGCRSKRRARRSSRRKAGRLMARSKVFGKRFMKICGWKWETQKYRRNMSDFVYFCWDVLMILLNVIEYPWCVLVDAIDNWLLFGMVSCEICVFSWLVGSEMWVEIGNSLYTNSPPLVIHWCITLLPLGSIRLQANADGMALKKLFSRAVPTVAAQSKHKRSAMDCYGTSKTSYALNCQLERQAHWKQLATFFWRSAALALRQTARPHSLCSLSSERYWNPGRQRSSYDTDLKVT